MVKPRIVLSRCLGLESCRYNAQMIAAPFVDKLRQYVEVIDVCPEADIGMGIPREPVRLVQSEDNTLHMLQPATGLDFTQQMNQFSTQFITALPEIDGLILKSRSPSCGLSQVKLFKTVESSEPLGAGMGLFAQALTGCYPDLAIIEDDHFNDAVIREHFLIKLFTLTAFRELKKQPSIAGLVEFQKRYKLIYMLYSQTLMRQLGKLVGNMEEQELKEVLSQYELNLQLLFSHPPNPRSHLNVLQHAFGYFKKELSYQEKQDFLKLLDDGVLSTLTSLIKDWSLKYNKTYLQEQAYFEPYPPELILPED